MKAVFLTLAALALPLHGCSDVVEMGTDVQLRLENASDQRFDRITVHTPDGPKVFVDLEAGSRTAYVFLTMSYRYATTEVVIGRDTLRLQAIDFVGEEPLPTGSYTFVYDLTGDGPPFGLTLALVTNGSAAGS